jgi:hypothetical protein
MREIVGLPPRLQNWWEILSGVYDPPGQPGQAVTYPPQSSFPVNNTQMGNPIDERPWEILRACLLWFLWCQKCEFDLRNGDFHIRVALYLAWQQTIQIGMGQWYELTKYNGDREKSNKQQQKEEEFLVTWSYGGVFCSTDRDIRWHIAPHREFLSRDLANRYRSFRLGLI